MSIRDLLAKLTTLERPIYIVASATLALFALAIIWLNIYPAQEDYPYHLVRFHTYLHVEDPILGLAETAKLSLFPTPYILMDYFALAFGQLFPIETVGKFILTTYVLLMIAGIEYFARAQGRPYNAFALLGYLFIFNWPLAKGFLPFAFSIPFFLFALGYWWKHKEQFTSGRIAILAVLVTLVYLANPGPAILLLVLFAALSFYFSRANGRIYASLLSFLPSIALLIAVMWRDFPNNPPGEVFAAVFNTIGYKLNSAMGGNFSFWTSLKLGAEKKILLVAFAIVAAASLWQAVRTPVSRERRGFILLLSILFASYLVFPDYLIAPSLFYVATRAIILFGLLVMFLPDRPQQPLLRVSLIGITFLIAAGHMGVTFLSYKRINQEYADLAAASSFIPAHKKLAYWSDGRISMEGNINGYNFFNGYYFVERAGSYLPWDEREISVARGPLKPLKFADHQVPPASDDEIFEDGCDLVSHESRTLVTYSRTGRELPARPTAKYNCERTATLGNFAIYREATQAPVPATAEPSTTATELTPKKREPRYYKKGFLDDHDYLLLYTDQENVQAVLEAGYELVFSKNRAHLLRRRSDE